MSSPLGMLSSKGSLGVQTLAHRSTSPTSHFSNYSDRGQASKQFISPAHTQAEGKGRLSPGPGIYTSTSAFSPQLESSKKNTARHSFGQSARWKDAPDSTLGPGSSDAPSSLGPQVLSSRASPPKTRFGSSTRDQGNKLFISSRHVAAVCKGAGPDPGLYNLPSSLGAQTISFRTSAPSFTQPKKERLKENLNSVSKSLPPAEMHDTWKDTKMAQALGVQAESQFKTMPAFKFGSGRDGGGRRFYSNSQMRTQKGMESPGNYEHQRPEIITGFGNQFLSSRTTPANCSFGKAQRAIFAPFKTSNTPGPGHYE